MYYIQTIEALYIFLPVQCQMFLVSCHGTLVKVLPGKPILTSSQLKLRISITTSFFVSWQTFLILSPMCFLKSCLLFVSLKQVWLRVPLNCLLPRHSSHVLTNRLFRFQFLFSLCTLTNDSLIQKHKFGYFASLMLRTDICLLFT